MNIRTIGSACLLVLLAPYALAVNDPPLSEAWNIRPSGSASSSGEIIFRVTPPDGSDPVEITVPVLAGTDDVAAARTIRRVLDSQLRSDQFNVTLGEGANVLVTDPRGRAIFSVELVTSDVPNMRIAVNATSPTAPPVVPVQSMPANSQTPATPAAPGSVTPPGSSSIPLPQQSTPTPRPSIPTPEPSVRPSPDTVRPPNAGTPPASSEPRPREPR